LEFNLTSRDFAYWLQGFLEIAEPENITKEQVVTIKKHLSMVFYHEIDPSFPKEQIEKLNDLHHRLPFTKDTMINC
jgi:hypothetical protein